MLRVKSVIGALMGSVSAPPEPPMEALSWALPRLTSRELPWSPVPGEFTPLWGGAARDGTGVDVYILDSGLDDTHPLFEGRATYLDDMGVEPPSGFKDGHGHGTACAGCIGGTGVGLASGALIWGYKVTTSEAGLDFTSAPFVANGLAAALAHYQSRSGTNRPAVLTMSFGGGTMSVDSVRTAVGNCVAAGMVVVAAAGNEGVNTTEAIYPAAHAGVLAVGGADQWDFRYFSSPLATNFGPHVPIYAPGNMVTTLQTRYLFDPPGLRTFSGTSASAPLVAGMIACMLQGKPRLTGYDEVLGVIRKVVSNATRDKLRFGVDESRPIQPQIAFMDAGLTTESVAMPAAPTDINPYEVQTTLSVNFTGADNSTVFTDTSPAAKTLTASGTARIVNNRLRLESGANYVTVTPFSGFQLLQAAPACPSYSLEFELVIHSIPAGTRNIMLSGPDSGGNYNFAVQIESNGRVTFNFRNASGSVRTVSILPPGAAQVDVPYRMAVCADGFVCRCYVNGVQTYTDELLAQTSAMANLASSVMRLGTNTTSADCSIGYIRITPGASRHSGYLAPMPNALGTAATIKCIGYMSSAYAASGTTRSVTVPAGVAAGDLLVVGVMHRSAMSTPAGWTLVGTATDAGSNQFHSIFSKVAVGGDAGASVTFTQSASGRMLASIVAARKSGGLTLRQVVSDTFPNTRISDFPILSNGEGPVFALACSGFWNNAGSIRPAIIPGFNLIVPHNSVDTRVATAFAIEHEAIQRHISNVFDRSGISEISGVLAVWE